MFDGATREQWANANFRNHYETFSNRTFDLHSITNGWHRSELMKIDFFLNWFVSSWCTSCDRTRGSFIMCPSKYDNWACANWSTSCFEDFFFSCSISNSFGPSSSLHDEIVCVCVAVLWNSEFVISDEDPIHDWNANGWHSHRAIWWYRSTNQEIKNERDFGPEISGMIK